MLKFFNLLIGSAGLAAIAVGATPATAQSMPYSGYSQGGGIGAVIGSLLGGDRIGTYDRDTNQVGVEQCARAAEAQVSRAYSSDRYDAYNRSYGNRGYDNRAVANARVTGITRVERQSSGLRVSGLLDSGADYAYQYGNQVYDSRYSDPRYDQGYGPQAYGYDNRVADMRFDCIVDYRGRVTNLDIKRNHRRGI